MTPEAKVYYTITMTHIVSLRKLGEFYLSSTTVEEGGDKPR